MQLFVQSSKDIQLVFEVPVNCATGDLRSYRDIVQRSLGDTVLEESIYSGFQNPQSGTLSLFFGPAWHAVYLYLILNRRLLVAT